MHSIGMKDTSMHLVSIVAQAINKYSHNRSPFIYKLVITALAKYFWVDLNIYDEVGGTHRFDEDILKNQHLIEKEGTVKWIKGKHLNKLTKVW
ncbi:unnamed protein product [Linum trigynum]|uniref:Uncharacterized protein n=1 Tax=Linum trigynum TaxID=586398 RepID=A0AAV2F7E7_9ROSI